MLVNDNVDRADAVVTFVALLVSGNSADQLMSRQLRHLQWDHWRDLERGAVL